VDNEKDMILQELFDTSTHEDINDVVLTEGWATEHTDKMRMLIDRAKELARQLDDRASARFKNEFNKQLMRFNDAVNKGEDIRNLEKQLLNSGAVFNKYKKKA